MLDDDDDDCTADSTIVRLKRVISRDGNLNLIFGLHVYSIRLLLAVVCCLLVYKIMHKNYELMLLLGQ